MTEGRIAPTATPAPDGLVGRVGMIAALRGVNPGDDGKLVLVRLPLGKKPDPRNRSRRSFQWQVLALGAAPQRNGKECRDLVLPDDCLRPVSQVDPRHVARLVKARAVADFHAAAADLARCLERTPLSEQEFEACLVRAGEMAMFEHGLEVVPVATALAEIGFVSADGGHTWDWSVVHRGVKLSVFGGPDLFEQWRLTGTCNTSETMMWDERLLDAQEQRGKVLSLVRYFWRQAFGPAAPVPSALSYAEEVDRHQRDMRKLRMDSPPTLWVDGQMLRATRRVLADRYGLCPEEAGPLPDVPMALSFDDHLLHIEVDGCHYAVQARGVWVEDCRISLREFLAISPQRLRGDEVRLARTHEALSLNRLRLAITRHI